MKKLPLVVIVVLISLVVISGMVDSEKTPPPFGEEKRQDRFLFNSPFENPDPRKGGYSIIHTIEHIVPRDETAFLEKNIEKSEDMVLRLNKGLGILKEGDQSNPELEQKINNYSSAVSEARDHLSRAEISSSESEKEEYLKLSRDSIIRANSGLKPIFDELKAYLPGPDIMDNSTLTAQGKGMCILRGNMDIDFFLSNGSFSIVDFSGDVLIDMEHDYEREDISERGQENRLFRPHDMLSYVNVTGNSSVSGSAYTIALVGKDIIFDARGTGEVQLLGNGTYFLDNGTAVEKNSWANPIFESD